MPTIGEITRENQIERGAAALRARQQAGRVTRPWSKLSNSDKRKWRDHAAAVLSAALDDEGEPPARQNEENR